MIDLGIRCCKKTAERNMHFVIRTWQLNDMRKRGLHIRNDRLRKQDMIASIHKAISFKLTGVITQKLQKIPADISNREKKIFRALKLTSTIKRVKQCTQSGLNLHGLLSANISMWNEHAPDGVDLNFPTRAERGELSTRTRRFPFLPHSSASHSSSSQALR